MNIKLLFDNEPFPLKVIRFSDGAVNYVLDEADVPLVAPANITFCVPVEMPINSIATELAMLTSAMQNLHMPDYCQTKMRLHLPYHPYARADRRFGPLESDGLNDWIGMMAHCFDLNSVSTVDCHSSAAKEFWEHHGVEFIELKQRSAILASIPNADAYDVVVAPDEGASEKAKDVALFLNALFVQATKVRDKANGRIIATELPLYDFTGKSVLIADDICDGGGTFLPLAQKLKDAGAAKVSLAVSHGIFSKGLDVFAGTIDALYAHQLIGNYVTREQILSFNTSSKEIN
jgi:ribose-phosphate pyrophosphokinase